MKYGITKDSVVCLVLCIGEVGDNICVFLGLKVPFIIHKVPDTSERYALVDECYADGFMKDDALVRDGSRLSDLVLV